jgi:hypothetical protein
MTDLTVFTVDPERITERVFGGPHFVGLSVVNRDHGLLRHPRSGRIYSRAEIAQAAWEGRNAREVICAAHVGEPNA